MTNCKFTLFIAIFLLGFIVRGQDIHFSQYYNNIISLNPAVSTQLSSDCRAQVLYRTQWAAISGFTPFKTIQASGEKKFLLADQNFAAGLMIFQDDAGKVNLSTTKVGVNLAYSQQLSNELSLSIGTNITYQQKKNGINAETTFPSQYDPTTGTFDPTLPNMSNNLSVSTSFISLGLGVIGSYVTKDQVFEAGLGILNINTPNESFFTDIESPLPMSINGHVFYDRVISSTLVSQSSLVIHTISSASEILLFQKLLFKGPNPLGKYQFTSVGLGSRLGESLVVAGGFSHSNFHVELSYDITYSQVRKQNRGRGGLELSLNYTCAFLPDFEYRSIPCKRY